MVLPSSRLGLGTGTSSSPSSSDSRTCCILEPLHDPTQESAPEGEAQGARAARQLQRQHEPRGDRRPPPGSTVSVAAPPRPAGRQPPPRPNAPHPPSLLPFLCPLISFLCFPLCPGHAKPP